MGINNSETERQTQQNRDESEKNKKNIQLQQANKQTRKNE